MKLVEVKVGAKGLKSTFVFTRQTRRNATSHGGKTGVMSRAGARSLYCGNFRNGFAQSLTYRQAGQRTTPALEEQNSLVI